MKISGNSKFLPGLFLVIFCFSCSSSNEKKEQTVISGSETSDQPFSVINGDTTWTLADRMPVYKGGERALIAYVGRSIVYPEEAKKAGTQGRVLARFRVGTDGRISMVSILKGVDPQLDAETVRVINSLSFEKPGYRGSRPVPVWYVLPVQYSLK